MVVFGGVTIVEGYGLGTHGAASLRASHVVQREVVPAKDKGLHSSSFSIELWGEGG